MAGWKAEEAPTVVLEKCGKRCESIRKDAECTFGICKKRHRQLKVPSLLHRHEDVDKVFRTSCILHNWNMTFDGLDTIGELDTDYVRVTGDEFDVDFQGARLPTDVELEEDILQNDRRARWSGAEQSAMSHGRVRPVLPSTDMMLVGTGFSGEEVETQIVPGYEEKRQNIAVHMDFAFNRGELMWLKPARVCRPDISDYGVRGPWCQN